MTHNSKSRARIAEAAEWRLFGLLLERPRRAWHAEMTKLGRETPNPELRSLVAAARGATEGDYLALVGPAGPVSPREVTYQPFADPGHLLADLATCYQAFAFHPRVEDPIDHIAVEAGFVGYLLLKEAFASARGAAAAVETTASARHTFIDAHLAEFAASFAQRLEVAGASYLVAPARALSQRVPARKRPARAQPIDEAFPACGACTLPEAW